MIWNLRAALAVVLSTAGANGAALAQNGQAPPRFVDDAAAELAAWSLRVMQPGRVAPRDLSVEGTGRLADGTPARMRFLASGGDQSRAEMTARGVQSVQAVSAGKGFRLRDGLRGDLPLWVSLYGRPDFVPAFSRLREWRDAGSNLEYLGEEEVSGRPTHRIRLWASARDGRPADVEEWISEYEAFIDAETGLVVKTVSWIFSPEILDNKSPVETYYADWWAEGPILAPHRVERWISGEFDSEWTLSGFRIDSGLPPSLFR